MVIKLNKIPPLHNPVLLACWPGIGNIGLLAVDTIRETLGAEEIGYIEPYEFFYPKKVSIRGGELINLEFPSSRFYAKKTEKRDILFFLGEEQPAWGNKAYAEGAKAYQMANYVLDVAARFGCQRIYTSGAAITTIHHSVRSKVWAVPNNIKLLQEIKVYQNTVLMSEVERPGGQGNITGLNGLLLGVAKKRGMDAICFMGEVPVYLQGFPILYPKGSKSVMEVLASALGIELDLRSISSFAERSESEINCLYDKLPAEARSQLDELKLHTDSTRQRNAQITEEDKEKILDDLDKFFNNKRGEEGEN
ncbi:MAG TPA: PAC2 family protein [Dehalococcoidia bacterium]|nr:PAC2 family protein [Dehalococcoidia bacterium]